MAGFAVWRALARDRRGGAAVEFALVGPVFVLLLMGMVVYGGWFWLAQGIQSAAAEGARAAIGGLDPAEQAAEARRFVGEHLKATTGLDPTLAQVEVDTTSQAIVVRVAYDVSRHPLMALSVIVPPPPHVIERSAAVRTGGY